jgi:hypothetical protein
MHMERLRDFVSKTPVTHGAIGKKEMGGRRVWAAQSSLFGFQRLGHANLDNGEFGFMTIESLSSGFARRRRHPCSFPLCCWRCCRMAPGGLASPDALNWRQGPLAWQPLSGQKQQKQHEPLCSRPFSQY